MKLQVVWKCVRVFICSSCECVSYSDCRQPHVDHIFVDSVFLPQYWGVCFLC